MEKKGKGNAESSGSNWTEVDMSHIVLIRRHMDWDHDEHLTVQNFWMDLHQKNLNGKHYQVRLYHFKETRNGNQMIEIDRTRKWLGPPPPLGLAGDHGVWENVTAGCIPDKSEHMVLAEHEAG